MLYKDVEGQCSAIPFREVFALSSLSLVRILGWSRNKRAMKKLNGFYS